jgi:hypothetical protein
MPLFEIESPHTKEECAAELQELQLRKEVLNKFVWGCSAGHHTAWALVEAQNENAARDLIPKMVRNKAKVTQVEKFTPEQIKDMLKMHA